MIFLLTDAEMIEAIRGAEKNKHGLFAVQLPAGRLAETTNTRPVLTFDATARTVRGGNGASVRLSPIQFRLLQHVYTQGKATFEELQDEIWDSTTSDGAIRAAVANANARLMDSGLGVELVAGKGKVNIESL
jgi:hypothetical protein